MFWFTKKRAPFFNQENISQRDMVSEAEIFPSESSGLQNFAKIIQ